MLNEKAKKWEEHSKQLANILQKFADCGADFIFGCELGGRRQGVKKVNINMNHIVHSVLPDAKCKNIWCVLRCPQVLAGEGYKNDESTVRHLENAMQPHSGLVLADIHSD